MTKNKKMKKRETKTSQNQSKKVIGTKIKGLIFIENKNIFKPIIYYYPHTIISKFLTKKIMIK